MLKLFLCLVAMSAAAVNSFSFNNVDPSANIDNTARLGRFLSIGRNVNIGPYSQVNNYASISADTTVGEDSIIGAYSNIGQRCLIANHANLNNYVSTGNDNVIGIGSVLLGYASIGNNVNIGKQVRMNQYSKIDDRVEIKDEAILDRYSRVNNNVKIHEKAYVGEYSTIRPDAIVNELAVIHKYVEILPGTTVKPKEVVIQSPSSYEMYQSCAPLENISPEHVNIAANRNSGAISPEFNNLLNGLIDAEMTKLKTGCDETNTPIRPQILWPIRTLYLIQFHGLDRFKENYREVWESQRFDISQLQNEFHFGENCAQNILESDVKKKLVQLLAIEQDEPRVYRVQNDSFCRMFEQIRKEEREVTCAKRNYY